MTLVKVPFIFPKYFFCSQQSTSIKVSDLSLVILSAFRLNVVELKPKLYQQPTSRKGNILEPTRAKARENAHDQGAIFFSFASDWLIKWCELPVLILEWSSVKPKQSRITLDTKMKITLSNDFWLVSVFYYGTQLETPWLWTVFVLIWCDNRILKCELGGEPPLLPLVQGKTQNSPLTNQQTLTLFNPFYHQYVYSPYLLFTSPKVLTRRICFTIKSFCSGRSFLVFFKTYLVPLTPRGD